MKASRVMIVAVLLFTSGLVGGHAAVRSYAKLSVAEQVALQESEHRVATYDQRLVALDRERQRHRISAGDYQFANDQLVFCIREESLFQNAILVRKSDLPYRAREVLGTMEHAVLMVPIGVGYVVAACPQVLEFLACIH
jgi:hypothetical protein